MLFRTKYTSLGHMSLPQQRRKLITLSVILILVACHNDTGCSQQSIPPMYIVVYERFNIHLFKCNNVGQSFVTFIFTSTSCTSASFRPFLTFAKKLNSIHLFFTIYYSELSIASSSYSVISKFIKNLCAGHFPTLINHCTQFLLVY